MFILCSQLYRKEKDAGGAPREVCTQNPQPSGGGLFLLDAGLHDLITWSSETSASRTSEEDAASGRVPSDHVQQTPNVRRLSVFIDL